MSVVQTFGMPNQHGVINCDGHLLHLRYSLKNADLVHVWVQPDAVGAYEPQSTCALL